MSTIMHHKCACCAYVNYSLRFAFVRSSMVLYCIKMNLQLHTNAVSVCVYVWTRVFLSLLPLCCCYLQKKMFFFVFCNVRHRKCILCLCGISTFCADIVIPSNSVWAVTNECEKRNNNKHERLLTSCQCAVVGASASHNTCNTGNRIHFIDHTQMRKKNPFVETVHRMHLLWSHKYACRNVTSCSDSRFHLWM